MHVAPDAQRVGARRLGRGLGGLLDRLLGERSAGKQAHSQGGSGRGQEAAAVQAPAAALGWLIHFLHHCTSAYK